MYWYVTSTSSLWSFSLSGTAILSFLNNTFVYILSSAQYIVHTWSSWFYSAPALPSRFAFASDAGSSPCIEPNHTTALAGLFTAALQQPCLHAWALVRAACWGSQLLLFCFTRLAAIRISCLLTSRLQPQPQSAMQCALQMGACEGLEFQVGAPMMSWKIFKQSSQVQKFNQRDEIRS